MRALTLTAFVVLLAATDGSALAASGCGKGMLWPYVRQPGDCLTDEEIQAGQRGVYNGPVNTNPDVSSIRIEEPPQATEVTGTSGAAPSSRGTPRAASAPSGPSLNGAGYSTPAVRSATACNKGWLWPFVREPGDCLTAVERQRGQGGTVYRSEDVVANATPAAAPPPPPVVTPVSADAAPQPNPADEAAPASDSADVATEGCRKGWLWPFVRRPGDCPTAAERRRSQ